MKIKFVDGFKIRNTIDEDFGAIGDCAIDFYIPKNEIWIDKAFKKEKDDLLKDFYLFRRLFKKNERAYEKTKAEQRREFMKKCRKERMCIIKPTKLKLLRKAGGIKIWLVDGFKLRRCVDPNFHFAGHGYVYSYIPKNEIWIDDKMVSKERKYIIVHEIHERKLMKKGKDYNCAHDYANAAEREARRKDGAHYVID